MRTNDLPDRILRKLRRCLKCGDEFVAEGPYNRLCPRCNQKNNEVAPLPIFGHGQHRVGVAHD